MQVSCQGQWYEVNLQRNAMFDSTGKFVIYPDDTPCVMTYNGPGGLLDTIVFGPDSNGHSFKQTITFDGNANVTAVSGWVLQ